MMRSQAASPIWEPDAALCRSSTVIGSPGVCPSNGRKPSGVRRAPPTAIALCLIGSRDARHDTVCDSVHKRFTGTRYGLYPALAEHAKEPMTTTHRPTGIEMPAAGTAPLDYDSAAAFYDATRHASPSLARAMLDLLGPPAGRTLLEVGCGTGNYARAFSDAGFNVVGVDISSGMLERAARRIPGYVAVADADRLPFADDSVDCIVTVNVFHHFRDQLSTFREFHRVARGSVLHHLTAGEQYRAHWAQHYFPLLNYEQPGEHADRRQLEALMADAGFIDVDAVRFDYTDTHDASFMPLRHDSPWRLCEKSLRRGVSTFRRLSPQEDADGEAALRADLRSGRFEQVCVDYERAWQAAGDSTLLVGRVPPKRSP